MPNSSVPGARVVELDTMLVWGGGGGLESKNAR
jgi:hypothetical protein